MKLKLKSVTAKLPAVAVSTSHVDRLALDYKLAKENGAKFAKKAEEASSAIKALAEKSGSRDGKRVVVEGRDYVIGYTEADSQPVFDEAKARRLLSSKLLNKCVRTQIDPSKLAELVELGELDRKTFAKLFSKSTKKTIRLYVGLRRQLTENPDEA